MSPRFKKVPKLSKFRKSKGIETTTSLDERATNGDPSEDYYSGSFSVNSVTNNSRRSSRNTGLEAPVLPTTSTSTSNIPNASSSFPNTSQSTLGPNNLKSGRGPSRGLNLDKIVKQMGKMKIIFNPGEKIPTQYVDEFSEAIGIVIRTSAELVGVSLWRQIPETPETNKEVCRRRLLKSSTINSRNRKAMPYSHTSGKVRLLTRYRKMANPNKIQLWKEYHLDKSGQFVNSQAESTYAQMNQLEAASIEDEGEPMSEDEILVCTLGHRSGYQKGMGGGVEVACGSIRSSAQQNSKLVEKLEKTQTELDLAKQKIDSLTEDLEKQKGINKSNEGKFEALEAQMQQMHQMHTLWLKMQSNKN